MPGSVLYVLEWECLGEGKKEKKKRREVVRRRGTGQIMYFSGTQGPESEAEKVRVGAAATTLRQVLRLRGYWR